MVPGEWGVDEVLKQAAEAGYEAVELIPRDEGELTLDTSEAELKEIRQKADAAGIELCSFCPGLRNSPMNLMTNDDELRQAALGTVRRLLNLADGLGVGSILLTMGSLTEDLYYNEAYANALKSLQTLAPDAERAGVNLAVEYVWNRFLLSPIEMARFLDEVASPRVGFYFDPGNMKIFGWPQQWVRICGRHIQMVHMKDFQGGPLNGGWTALLDGDVNFPEMMAELRKAGYDGPLVSEVSMGDASLADTAATIRKIIEM